MQDEENKASNSEHSCKSEDCNVSDHLEEESGEG